MLSSVLIALILSLTGLPRVESPALDALAELRAHEVAVGGLDHRYLDELNNGQWSSWGEVVGWTTCADPATAIVHGCGDLDGWADSPAHYAVLFNPDYTHIGCGSEQRLTDSEVASAGWYFVCILAVSTAPPIIPDAALDNGRDLELLVAILLLVALIVFIRRKR
jgi:hypothetical protein